MVSKGLVNIVIIAVIIIAGIAYIVDIRQNNTSFTVPDTVQNPFADNLILPPQANALSPDFQAETLSIQNASQNFIVVDDNESAKNGSYDTVMGFLSSVDTGRYALPIPSPADYAVILYDEAEAMGIKCRIIGTSDSYPILNDWGEVTWGNIVLVAFDTTDNGTIYADPSSWNVTGQSYYSGVVSLTGDENAASRLILTKKTQAYVLKDFGDQTIYFYANRSAAPVSYNALMSFIGRDNSSQAPYILENGSQRSYTCMDFAAHLFNDANAQGIKCGLVFIDYLNESHAVDAFPTTDEGIVFIDPQGPCFNFIDNSGKQIEAVPIAEITGQSNYEYYLEHQTGGQIYKDYSIKW
jgi:hypothetical protein